MVDRQAPFAFVISVNGVELNFIVTVLLNVGEENRWVVDVGNRRIRANDIGRHFKRVTKRRCRREAEASNRLRISAHDDYLAKMLKGVASPIPHVERMYPVVGVAISVEMAVPLVFGELLFKVSLDDLGIG